MKYIIRIALLAIIIFLGYKIIHSVLDPIKQAEELEAKEKAIVKRLKVIRQAQLAYRDVNERFTSSFDTLIDFMKNGELRVLTAYGDKDDSTTVFRQEIRMVSVYDSMFSNIAVDSVRYVPGKGDLEFEIGARFITKNKLKVPVFQVTDPDPDNPERIKEEDPLRVGNLNDVDYNGNWGKGL